MSYLVKARARLDLKSHWRYIARDNRPAADRLLEAAEETFKLISETPDLDLNAASASLSGSAPVRLRASRIIWSFTRRGARQSSSCASFMGCGIFPDYL